MNIILWMISPLIFIIGITGIAGLYAWVFNKINWNDSWIDKMAIINAIIISIIMVIFFLFIGTYFIHEILNELTKNI